MRENADREVALEDPAEMDLLRAKERRAEAKRRLALAAASEACCSVTGIATYSTVYAPPQTLGLFPSPHHVPTRVWRVQLSSKVKSKGRRRLAWPWSHEGKSDKWGQIFAGARRRSSGTQALEHVGRGVGLLAVWHYSQKSTINA